MTSLLLYLASILSAVLAMKTKENAFTLPIVITLYEFFFFKGSIKTRILYLAPFLLTMLIIPLSLIGIDKPVGEIISGVEPATRGYEEISRTDYLFTQFRVIVTYIRLLFLPVNQTLVYDYPVYNSFLTPQVFLSFLFLLSIFGFGLYLYYHSRYENLLWRYISFGVFWFFVTLSVESFIIPLPIIIDEYRIYLPSVGAIFAIVTGVFMISRKLKKEKLHPITISFLILLQVVLAMSTYTRNDVWRSKISLWENVVKKSPKKAEPYINLALAYSDKGWVDKAIEHYKTALSLRPNFPEAHNNLGLVYFQNGFLNRALREFEMALRENPNDQKAQHYFDEISNKVSQ